MYSTKSYTWFTLGLFSLLLALPNCSQKKASPESAAEVSGSPETAGSPAETPAYYTLDDFAKIKKVDAHFHIRRDDAAIVEQAQQDNFQLLNINVNASANDPIEKQRDLAVKYIRAYPEQVSFATTFPLKNFNEPAWQQQAIAYLKDSFGKGAIGVKTWKNIGMELKDKQGKFVMIDNPKFDPILDYIAQNKITLISHQGEPKNCWLPVEEMTVEGDKTYFTEHPQYHMYKHPEYPSYDDQINARDHMLEKHPDLKVVSVHLASLEWNVDEIAKRLDKYPNLAVDMAARISHLQHQAVTDWQKVHDFFIKYQDRLLYGTDIIVPPGENATAAEVKKDAHQVWLEDWKFFTTNESLSNSSDKNYKGLQLPREVIDKIYYQNAVKWIPGLKPR
ncbi:amidohydrolase family protein [Adhaeribacter swui]|uniref:Amidohydrolase family protein n=1 Tax=Adhaeribacter swui TaxID=2086471 RepID=A0A7G7G6T4_9BACT|nr:amidohydrolase family protein [Adhaeribacter swui]QNF32868.1 amidohydrolase family protein [Adhaeribacter swui]